MRVLKVKTGMKKRTKLGLELAHRVVVPTAPSTTIRLMAAS